MCICIVPSCLLAKISLLGSKFENIHVNFSIFYTSRFG